MNISMLSKPLPNVPLEGLLYREPVSYDRATQPAVNFEDFEIIEDENYEEDPPLESDWHVAAMALLVGILRDFWEGRDDIYVSGNTVVRFDKTRKNRFRGPDLYIVKGVADKEFRRSWNSWEENDLNPNFILELASLSTATFDVTAKKRIYERELKTPEYMVYNPDTDKLQGWRMKNNRYKAIKPNQDGRLFCEEIGLWLGLAKYPFFKDRKMVKIPRFFDNDGQLVLTRDETETQLRRAAEAKAQRAEAEVARLKALLENLKK